MSLTIPACLEALGGMKGSDSPILWMSPPGSDWPPPSRPMAIHPLARPVPTVGRILVEQSEPTLLRVLCRHLGWQGNHRPLMRIERRGRSLTGDPGWVLRSLTKWGDAPVLDDDPNFYVKLPAHISTDLDYLEALAAAVVWYARVERAIAKSTADDPDHHRWTEQDRAAFLSRTRTAEALASAEQILGLPSWEVRR